MKTTQRPQNRLGRMLNNSRINDIISIHDMLKKFNLVSVIQLAGQIKHTKAWKAMRIRDYPMQLIKSNIRPCESNRSLRPGSTREVSEYAKYRMAESSFNIDAARMWNNAPTNVKNAKNIYSEKSQQRKI